VTDAMDMDAISKGYGSGEAAVMAYMAGCDVIEIPADPVQALDALVQAAAKKRIAQRRIKETANRIAALKKWVTSFQDDVTLTLDQAKRGHAAIALESARRAMSISGRLRKIYPPLVVLAFADEATSPKPEEWFGYFSSWYSGEASGVVVTSKVSEEEMRDILGSVEAAGTIIAAFFVRPRGYAGTVGLSDDQNSIMNAALERPVIMVNFGNPYLLGDAEPTVRIDTYSASSASLAASIEGLNRVVK
jgi:hypothetical protein